ncbi:XrtB/PEP-CTERM-associated transcriptional regulator EpsA [Aquabacterium sp. A08]|uniref:XrtB/PEP-CTERM-associated transcriptional regulator EpsA n=1 Tax=Aquabacterium sp. A08 TaxID=2718532 RepID=UPI001AAE4932|nr:XrtB/PEP-CTERM-associated transcriptional regulator EpsA [Aquabacterium sp. A08]
MTFSEIVKTLKIIKESLSIRSHYQLFHWLHADVQHFIPHDLVIAAWGDFSLGLVCYDVVSPLPGLRTESFDDRALQPFFMGLFHRWLKCDHAPYSMSANHGFELNALRNSAATDAMQQLPAALVHGIKDKRGRHDCLYVFMGREELAHERARETLRYMLPYIDTAFRQVAHLPDQYLIPAPTKPTPAVAANMGQLLAQPDTGLSARELEIMEWVRMGKTNQEIGMILDISAFTVKNHVQRIFKKLDVVNRAQAVAKVTSLRKG